jgi:methylated-DNA-[protein]-cysteine S-methyltransferase
VIPENHVRFPPVGFSRVAIIRSMQTTLETPVGKFLLETSERGLVTCGTWLKRSPGRDDSAHARRHLEQAKDAIHEYFAGKRRSFDDLELRPEGTEFQLAVWAALRALPYGSSVSYGELAQRIRRPRAIRAVGQANAKNPLGVVVPCHRVIGKSGALVGFGGGLPMKSWLLRHEREVLGLRPQSLALSDHDRHVRRTVTGISGEAGGPDGGELETPDGVASFDVPFGNPALDPQERRQSKPEEQP